MPDRTLHLVFKTHLDIGFTDHAEKVRRQYHERFIPQALDTAEHFYRENPDRPMFIWTTGAWLIWDHLETQPPEAVRRLERAIGLGLVRWHALPFTVHSELMSPALFRAGLSFGQELDRRFGKTTVAAKMTDVPGHTRGIIKPLAEAGIRFLHIGVNSASPPPDVPDVFRWRGEDGDEVVVMYQKSYGATCFPPGLDAGLSFAHTNDNAGPQSISQTVEVHRRLAAEYPGTTIRAATMDGFAELLWARRADFPVVDLELGDSWIHGAASDPVKTQRFLALQRLYDRFEAERLTPPRLAFGRRLALVAEHTCGVDVKTFLRDEEAWDRPAFEAARRADYRFAYTEASWAEQRAYLDEAVAALEPADRAIAAAELQKLEPVGAAGNPVDGSVHAVGGYEITIEPTTGDIAGIAAANGVRLTGRGGSLIGYRYESYDENDVAAHLDTYLTERPDWALLDHGKPGLERARTRCSARFVPSLAGITRQGDELVIALAVPGDAHAELGAPARLELRLSATGEGLTVTLQFWGKPANRMPEAGFLILTPEGAGDWHFRKAGLWQPADRVAGHGGGKLQAVSAIRADLPDGRLEWWPLDTPLVGPADAAFMPFDPRPPRFDAGVRICLHNNNWGTNFPMWWEGDFKARFRLSLAR
ncbi:MAG: DUF5054 domain-containing protein [Devosia sp.]